MRGRDAGDRRRRRAAAISARRQISPGPFMPELEDRRRARRRRAGAASAAGRRGCSACRRCAARRPAPKARSRIAASISLVVVLPLLPVIATTRGAMPAAVEGREVAERGERVAHDDRRRSGSVAVARRARSTMHRAGAAPRRLGDEGVAVVRARRGGRRRARPARSRRVSVVTPAKRGAAAERRQLAARRREHLGERRRRAAPASRSGRAAHARRLPSAAAHLLAIVEVALLGADDLVVLVPLAGDEHEVARPREPRRRARSRRAGRARRRSRAPRARVARARHAGRRARRPRSRR